MGCFRFATNEVAIYPPKTPVACGPSHECRLPLVAGTSIKNFLLLQKSEPHLLINLICWSGIRY